MELFEQPQENDPKPRFGHWINKSRHLNNRKKRSKEDVEEEEHLVNCLVNLARGEGNIIKNNNIDNSPGKPESKKRRVVEKEVEENIIENNNIDNSPGKPKAKKRRRVVEKEALHNVHKCSECGRVFGTGQALGGHMSTHTHVLKKNKERDITSATTVCHKCSDCGVTFESGQALGGHMCRHRGDAAAKGSTSTSEHGGDEGPSGSGGDVAVVVYNHEAAVVVHDFDLNQPPPEFFLCDEEDLCVPLS